MCGLYSPSFLLPNKMIIVIRLSAHLFSAFIFGISIAKHGLPRDFN